jgi:thiamine biosynthesis lipoprotein ApbE
MTAPVHERTAAAEWSALGCLVRVVVTDPPVLGYARGLLADELAALDAACSRFRADSEVARLEAAAGAPARISPMLAGAVAAALRGARLTDGDVDPTLGAAMSDAGYDRDFALVPATGPAVRVRRQPRPVWQQIHLDEEALTLSVPAGVRLDLGATAKAYAADRAAARIARATGSGVLVALGGDIAVAGRPPAAGWAVRVQDVTTAVTDGVDGPTATVAVRGGGLATSSTTARRWVRGGRVMHHILDPRSGVPVASPWRTVSVAAATCLDANIASTASIVRGRAAVEWLQWRGLPARLVDHAGGVTVTGEWPEETS